MKVEKTKNRVSTLFDITYPVVQAGMVWCSGWELAAAVSNAGGLGLIGSGSMTPEVLRSHVRSCRRATDRPFGVNVPLLYARTEEIMQLLVDEQVRIVFTSAGNPAAWTAYLHDHGMIVAHVVSSTRFAKKSEDCGVDAVVAEGFEAGGHNGREETTTMCLVPQVREAVSIPVIAAGGIGDGRAMLAAFALGAEGVQIGSRFVASVESSAHQGFKDLIVSASEGDTELVMKALTPVRLLKNAFYDKVKAAEQQGASGASMKALVGSGRSRMGMFEGLLDAGELEIGQVSAAIRDVLPAGDIVRNIMKEFYREAEAMCAYAGFRS